MQGFRQETKALAVPTAVGLAATALTGGAAAPLVVGVIGEGTAATLTTAAISGVVGGVASNGTSNAMNGKPVMEGADKAAVLGAALNVGGAVVGQTAQAFGEGVREGTAIGTATNLAKQAAADGATGGAATAMVSQDGQVFTGLSKNAGGGPISDAVKNSYGSARTTCAETRALTQAEIAGANMKGGTSATASVGGKNPPGTPMAACDQACAPVLKNKGIGDAVAGTRGASTPARPVVPVPPSSTDKKKDQ